jgi:ABC-type lipoprotein export system ATPase subunit
MINMTAQDHDTAAAAIVAEGLTKHFTMNGHLIKAVDGVSFALAPRQLIAVLGPSGCGKSTLLYLLGGLEKPTAGTLVVNGVDVGALAGRQEIGLRRRTVGFVFQAFHLIPNLTALENVMLPLELAGRPRPEREERARDLLSQVGIAEERQAHRPGKLSGGEQQRVAIARALANDPAIVLADEPTGNLDARTGQRIVELLQRLASGGRTVVLVTHNARLAQQADSHLELEDGRIVDATAGLVPAHAGADGQGRS